MLKRYIRHILRATSSCHREQKRKRDGEEILGVSVELSCVSAVHQRHKDSVVRIVMAGGMVELYTGVIQAYMVMKKYPGLCLGRPEIFEKPHDSIVAPEEKLLPGQKFYLVPQTTVKKLIRRKLFKKLKGDEEAVIKEVVSDKIMKEEGDGEILDKFACTANDFYVSRERWSKCFARRFGKGVEKQPFVPPIKKVRMRQGLLGGWKPSLTTVKELSP